MNILLVLLAEFLKIGLFAIGGGLATLPFLYQLGESYGWFNVKDLAQMLAIADIVPGPVGTNLAAYVGFKAGGFLGSFASVLGILIPSLICVFIIAKLLKEFEGNRFVKSIFYMLKPASCAMIVAIGLKLLFHVIIKHHQLSLFSIDWFALGLFLVLISLTIKKEHSPLFYLGISAFAGILVYVVKIFI